FRAQQGEGDNHWRIQLQLENPRTTPIAELKLFGVEMVYIPEGAFELGTTKSVRQRREELTPGAGGAPYDSFFKFSDRKKGNYGGVYRVSSEETISIGKVDGNLFWQDISIRGTNTFSGVPKGKLEADFPKGYKGFYCMKYELSQQQYCDFLNTIDAMPQRARDITSEQEYNRPIRDYRNMIHNYEGDFVTSRPLRPCNFLSWLDGQAYADWAGLRHMTELEFEKACRGPKPAVYREYVWGVNEIAIKSNMVFSTKIMMSNGALAVAENGLIQTDGNVHASMFSYFNIDDVCKPGAPFYDPDCDGCRGFSGGDGGRGPVRMGIFGVNSNGDRIAAGATYYGLMEMGGNLQEPVVTVGHPSGRKFQGTHGNGVLSANGQATNADWQPIDGDYAFAGRGGCWKFHENHARTADRFKGLRTKPDRRASHIGFRGVRTRN
ncbi:MAG: SUMF1/EgtB/PvdO family nonheme iron enzyme, partial [Bacteroidota bacterium]